MIDPNQFSNFPEASRSVLEFLSRHHDLDLWMIARKHGDDWIVLHVEQNPYDITAGMVFQKTDILCAGLINDPVAKVLPRLFDDSACSDLPMVAGTRIGAYIGVPLLAGDGRWFGTLCALDRNERPELGKQDLALIELLAGL
ncbi:MAG: GAF domain-containing protein, partial [Wenzhouxiangellaceae bacterium]